MKKYYKMITFNIHVINPNDANFFGIAPHVYTQTLMEKMPNSWSEELIYKRGFWLNDQYKITDGDDNVYWVPPSQILNVQIFEDT